ncbi:MAG: hypothetical protein R3B90_03460 [Planctomycetaceae bacterium]
MPLPLATIVFPLADVATVMPLIASGLMGAGVFVFWWSLTRWLASEDAQQDDEWRFDVNRINELRQASPFYRMFQPVIQGSR